MTLALAALALGLGSRPAFPPLSVGAGWGVNLHFNDLSERELNLIAGLGSKWIRRDLFWHEVEQERGKYNFATFDRLVAQAESKGMRTLFILCYGNGLYGEGSPHNDTMRKGFANYVRAAIRHFRGRGIVWEMWNEPNNHHWPPRPNVEEYIALAREVGEVFRQEAPQEIHVGPGLAGMDWTFLERCFRAGLLQYWQGVTVHPYRPMEPETVSNDYARLRAMIDRFKPKGKEIAILSGEWGYSAASNGLGEVAQADFVIRQQLVNLANHVPVSIWYNWSNNGNSPTTEIDNFGLVRNDLSDKPASIAIRSFHRDLNGYKFHSRISVGDARDWLLLFTKGQERSLVGWTTRTQPVSARFGADLFTLRSLPQVIQPKPSTSLRLAERAPTLPVALSIGSPEAFAKALAPLVQGLHRGEQLSVNIEGAKPLVLGFGASTRTLADSLKGWEPATNRSEGAKRVVATLRRGASSYAQEMLWVPARPLAFSVAPVASGVRVDAIGEFTGRIELQQSGRSWRSSGVTLTAAAEPQKPFRVVFFEGSTPVLRSDLLEVRRLTLQGSRTVLDGDAKVPASADLKDGRLAFEFGAGWRYLMLQPQRATPLPGRPVQYGITVDGDGSGAILLMRYEDATGQTFQPEGIPIEWKGPRRVTFGMRGETGGRWGGANNGIVHAPVRVTAFAVVDNPGGRGIRGQIGLRDPYVLSARR
jgi:hypothetical protein